ncbi:MAG: PHP domain-containing protein [Candidatus Verstraetearchaeota archaeon]|nr:PHP domain-containing protein [Candidatus Verstraetearchaeota archaeon]
MLFNIDLHVHTDRSPDGCSTLLEIAAIAKLKGLHGLALTDHDIMMHEGDSMRLSRELGILVVPGVELTTEAGHLIILNPKRNLLGLSMKEAAHAASIDGSPIIIPHLMDPISHGIGEEQALSLLTYSPLIEVLNASTFSRYNHKASFFATSHSLPAVGGSDAHLADAVGDAYTVVDSPSLELGSVLAAISDGRTMPSGGRTSLATAAKTVFARFMKRISRA